VFALTGVFFFSLGVLSWLLQIKRRLLEELVYRSREQRYSPFAKPDRRFPEWVAQEGNRWSRGPEG